MATYYFRNNTATWATAANWSLTSGGGATGEIPTPTDDVIFDSNSRSSCTLNSNRDCRSISFTNWTGTFDMSNVFLRIYGNIDFGDALFSIITPGSWQVGATTGVMNGQTIRTNGKTMLGTLSFGFVSGTNPAILLDNVTCQQLQIQSNIGSPSNPIFSGNTLYVTSNIITSSNERNLYAATPIKMIGTGFISTFNSNAALCCDLEIITSGTVTFNGNVYTNTNFNFKYTSGNVVTTGSNFVINQNPVTIDSGSIMFNFVTCNNTITLNSTLYANNIQFGSGGLCTLIGTAGFNVNNLYFILNGRTLSLSTGNTYTVNSSMICLAATIAAKNLIKSNTPGVSAIFNLGQSATQDNGYLSATDIDSSGGRSIWTYKGIISNTKNWNLLSTNPKKHILVYKNRVLKKN